jgi:hypothetical protein
MQAGNSREREIHLRGGGAGVACSGLFAGGGVVCGGGSVVVVVVTGAGALGPAAGGCVNP